MARKDHPIYNNYQITDDGRVWSKLSNRYLKVSLSNSKYLYVCIKGQWCSVARLVLEAFVGPAPINYEACHNDGNRHFVILKHKPN